MNEVGQVLKDYWAVIAGFIGAIVWFARVENRTTSNEKEIIRLEKQREEDVRNAQRNQDIQNGMLVEVRADIKKLLERGN